MVKHTKRSLGLLLCCWLGVSTAFSCTTFVLKGDGRIYFGRNMDWFSEDGLVIVNQRNIRKTAFVTPGNTPAQWTSRYGSVTFNCVGQELPAGGMNEAGLVVENMWLGAARYPDADSRPAVNSLEWIQYQLDCCRTVAEVATNSEQLRIDPGACPSRGHYLVCDANGDCATIEFILGKTVCHRGESLPWCALANDPYGPSAAHLKAHPEPEGSPREIRAAYRKQNYDGRFAHAATRAARFKPGSKRQDLDYAFQTLDEVHQGLATVWRLVYDIPERRIYFRTRSHPQERVLDFKSMNFACGGPVRFFNLHPRSASFDRFQSALPTAAPQFENLTEEWHRSYVEAYLDQGWFKRAFGNMKPIEEAMFLHLREESPGGAEGSPAASSPLARECSVSAEEVLRKAFAARGGREAAARIQSVHSRGTVDMSWSTTTHAPLDVSAMRPNKLLVTAETKPGPKSRTGHYEYGFDGQRGWEIPLEGPPHALEGKALDECRAAAEFSLDEPEDYVSARCLGAISFDGRKCWALKLVTRSGTEEIHYYDAASYLLAGLVEYSSAGATWVRRSLDDYRVFGGFKFPTWTRCQRQGNSFVTRMNSIEVNTVQDSVFKVPLDVQANNPRSAH